MDKYIEIYYSTSFTIAFEGIAVEGVFDENLFEKYKGKNLYPSTSEEISELIFDKMQIKCSIIKKGCYPATTYVDIVLFINAKCRKNDNNSYCIMDLSDAFIKFEISGFLRKLFALFSCSGGEPSYIREKEVLLNNSEIIRCTNGIDKNLVKIVSREVQIAYFMWKDKTGKFEDMKSYALKLIGNMDDCISSAIFWIDVANFFKSGENDNDHVKKFMYTWMAFNSLYSQDCGGEQKQIEAYINNNPEIKRYINELFNNKKESLNAFVKSKVKLQNAENLYQHLDTYINNKSPQNGCKCLETTLILCLYAVRCNIFHGKVDTHYLNLVRLCIELLDSIVKKGIIIRLNT